MDTPRTEVLAGSGISKLEAEPQEGPVEYKLHLLLRPRRRYTSTSTVQNVSGSHLSKSRTPGPQSEPDIKQVTSPSIIGPSSQSRQNRLQHLTTQLLWRLQQSSPYHSSSKSNLVLPILPEIDVERSASRGPRPLIPGLESSSGALYEIGVSDDGTFVGLTTEELEESLIVLRAMAFSLGCNAQILRMMIVGDCQWADEEVKPKVQPVQRLHDEMLWVAEVFVAPNLETEAHGLNPLYMDDNDANMGKHGEEIIAKGTDGSGKEQLRVTLTGSTTSGKSSLLGTLSTSTLDNGRGRSRLSLLKHRHEIVSGVTSSLAQELFGYQDAGSTMNRSRTKVINYASGNVSSWEDIHNASEPGRLVFVTDTAGHPRYRRTTVRGLVSWAPHWTLCCIAADDQEDSTGKVGATASASEILGSTGFGTDLSKAHLNLCLKLDLPLVVVITKLDLATKTGLRDTLSKVLTALKSAGRKPVLISSSPDEHIDPQLESVSEIDQEVVRRAIDSVEFGELRSLVPIILTSAVAGSGVGKLHAILRHLPIAIGQANAKPIMQLPAEPLPGTLFHVDEVFALGPSQNMLSSKQHAPTTIISGYLRYGLLSVGDAMLIGPCVSDNFGDVEGSWDLQRARSYPELPRGSLRQIGPTHSNHRLAPGGHVNTTEEPGNPAKGIQIWHQIRITSLRNLRLPVRTLAAGQVGTIGISFCTPPTPGANNSSPTAFCIRRGMVMLPVPSDAADAAPKSYHRFSAVFQEAGLPAWPGVLVIVYTASIRASAKIVEVKALETGSTLDGLLQYDGIDGNDSDIATPGSSGDSQQTEITFEFATTQEWLEIGTQILVTPGGGPSLTGQPEQREVGSAGLDGYVGTITRAAGL